MKTQRNFAIKAQILLLVALVGTAAAQHNGRKLMGDSAYISAEHMGLSAIHRPGSQGRELKLFSNTNSEGGSNTLGILSTLASLLGGLSKGANDDDVGSNGALSSGRKCDCDGTAPSNLVQEFLRYCNNPDGNCCRHLGTAGAGDLEGCPCASKVACQIAPFNGPAIMAGCGYDYGC